MISTSFRLFRNRGDGAATAFINSRAEAQTPQREIATSCGSVTLYKHWITIKGGQSPVFESLESENIVENDTLADVDEGNSVPVAFMEIRNVSKSNSMDWPMMMDFRSAVDALESGQEFDDCAGLVLTGQGSKVFCAGANLSSLPNLDSGEALRMSEHMQETTSRLRALPLVSVAALEGVAIGGGAEMSTATDFRFISSSSYVHFKHVLNNVTPGWGGGGRLVDIVGRRTAIKMLVGGMKCPPDYLLECQFVDRVCKPGTTKQQALEWVAKAFCSIPGQIRGARACKKIIGRADSHDDDQLDSERKTFQRQWKYLAGFQKRFREEAKNVAQRIREEEKKD